MDGLLKSIGMICLIFGVESGFSYSRVSSYCQHTESVVVKGTKKLGEVNRPLSEKIKLTVENLSTKEIKEYTSLLGVIGEYKVGDQLKIRTQNNYLCAVVKMEKE